MPRPSKSVPRGYPARLAALRLLDAVLRRDETLDSASKAALRQVDSLADQALARAIAAETLRWLTDLDFLIDGAMQKLLGDDAKARMVLRIMLAQWLRLETPPHAVISTGLELLDGGARKLAHGVFSRLVKDEVTLPDAPNLPAAAMERYQERGEEIAKGLAVPPPLDLSLRDPSKTAEWAETLGGESFAPGHIRLPRGAPVDRLEGFKEGEWWVQDFAASLPARLLGSGEGRRVLDLCAAPGGKTMQLAAAGWKVTALDSSSARLERLKENLKRVNLEADTVKADALHWTPAKQFDAILLDAPCTATGTCRRHPEVLHRVTEKDVTQMAAVQERLIAKAAGFLPEGGALVYAVCSLEREEGEGQAELLPLKPYPITAAELPMGLEPDSDGWLRTHPGLLPEQGGMDGFFVARWRK